MQRNPIGLAHKYWGKKPFFLSQYIISNYTKEGDVILDPFCGSGSLIIDGIFNNRKVIGIDINPTSILFNKVISDGISYKEIKKIWLNDFKPILIEMEKKIYSYNSTNIIRSLLRSKEDDKIIAIKLNNNEEIDGSGGFEFNIKDFNLHKGFNNKFIKNSRLSLKDNTLVKDFFSDISLYSNNFILTELLKYPKEIQEFFLIGFTANIANCSKLLPPIKSRGRFAPGAWMTGFYIANEYIDNNVFHYFFNRVEKLLKGKKYFEEKNIIDGFGSIDDVFSNKAQYNFSNGNSMNLELPSNSINVVITDPPYEGVVPYLEQSFIWNSFIDSNIIYENEIVVSDSKDRNKNIERFREELGKSFCEINRVLKNNGKFILTYNSIKKDSLDLLDEELNKAGFSIVDILNVTQKASTPRQINREKTVKGDLLIVCTKQKKTNKYDFSNGFIDKIKTINFYNYNN